MSLPVPELDDHVMEAARRLARWDQVLIVSHIDADGLTSAAIAAEALTRADCPHRVAFRDQLNEQAIDEIAASDYEAVLFTDFGSGQLPHIEPHAAAGDFEVIIADHHQPAGESLTNGVHCNPLLAGVDGAAELSGAGMTYLLARGLGAVVGFDARDLAALAVVGAIGDRQTEGGELVGANAAIAADGADVGAVETGTDLAIYGAQTRPLPKLLAYADDVRIPGVTGNRDGTQRFLEDLQVELRHDGEWLRWIDLDAADKQTVVSALIQHALSRGVPASALDRLTGARYTFPEEPAGTPLREATEFATLLNATARYDRADVGLAVCLGDREAAFEAATELLREHRRQLSAGVKWVEDNGVTREDHCQWFHAGDAIRETIVGIVAGMAVGVDGVDRSVPIVAFAEKSATEVKISARGTPQLVERGLDLAAALAEAAAAVDGDGGGHTVAAGATIPAGTEETFLKRVDAAIGGQLED